MDNKKLGLFDPQDEEIVKLIPKTAKRVRVQDIDGQEKWRDPQKFLDGDFIIIENGEPRCMFRVPGRKSKKEEVEEFLPEGTTEDASERIQKKQEFLDNDELIRLARENPDDDEILSLLLTGLAEEAGSLAFERSLKEERNQETSQTSLRRVNTLKAMAEILFKRKEQKESSIIDLKSPQFFVLLKYILETFRDSMKKAHLNEEAINVVMENLQNAFKDESWASLAVRKMKEE